MFFYYCRVVRFNSLNNSLSGYIVYEVYIKTGVLLQSDGGKWTKGIVEGIPQINTLNHLSFTQVIILPTTAQQ